MQEETLDQRFDSESASNITQQHRLESDASSFRATQNPSRNTQKSTDNSNEMYISAIRESDGEQEVPLITVP